MRRPVVGILCAMLVGFAGWWIGIARAGDDAGPKAMLDRYPLRGLPGVQIVVKPINPDARRDGLDGGQIRSDVEAQLRKAGIRILAPSGSSRSPDSPHLYVRIGAVKHPNGLYAYSTQVLLAETVRLERDPSIKVVATTWTTGGVAPVERPFLRDAVRQSVADKVGLFINDYAGANPNGRDGSLRSAPPPQRETGD